MSDSEGAAVSAGRDEIEAVREDLQTFHVDMCPDCGAVPFQHGMDPPWFCEHPRDRYVEVECAPIDDTITRLDAVRAGRAGDLDPPLTDIERRGIESMRTAQTIVGGEPALYDWIGLANEVTRLRAELERETQLRREAERHLAELKAYCDTQPYPDEMTRAEADLRKAREAAIAEVLAVLATNAAEDVIRHAIRNQRLPHTAVAQHIERVLEAPDAGS